MTAATSVPTIKPGVYYDLPAHVYHASPALSNSGLKLLAIDPLEFWHQIVNPEREPSPSTPSQDLGTALHAAVLEPDTFLKRYDWERTEEDFPGCLKTSDHIKEWLDAHTVPYKKSDAKPALKALAKRADPTVRILEDETATHEAANLANGVNTLSKTDWARVNGMARALLREPEMKALLSTGKREVSIFAEDPVTGVLMKCRMDWWAPVYCDSCGGDGRVSLIAAWPPANCPNCSGTGVTSATIVDPKTFSTQGLPVNVAVKRAIQTYGYVNQAVFYKNMHLLAGFGPARWINAFVSTEDPFHVRLRELGPDGDSGTHKYWDIAEKNMRTLINRYAEYRATFGDRPWAYAQRVELVGDSDVKVWEEGE